MPAAAKAIDTACVSIPTPAAAALGHSSSFRADVAECKATSDDEHAVSNVKQGPVSPSMNETRPEATDRASEVPENTEGSYGPAAPLFDIRFPLEPRKKPIGAFFN